MAITQRQFNHLKEMGVNVWQQRNSEHTIEHSAENPETKNTEPSVSTSLAFDLNQLTQQQLFVDVLQCIDISIGEITSENNIMNLGLFNWQFKETDSITFSKSVLTTPMLTAFESNSQLKKDLWQIIQQKVLA
ncbi:DNA polymerase III subunit psi [Pseudocolwellia agarivorans]|uniref:DNA polymerase III subunit psi n=1 Tax=Pseudocolwellia agarivorans TaxID=1911682 RepID=UPI003F882CF3